MVTRLLAPVASVALSLDTVILPLIVVALPAGIGKFPVVARVVPLAGEGMEVVDSPVGSSVVDSGSEVEREEDSSD